MVDPVMRAAVKSGAYEATWFVLSVVASYRSLGCVGDVPALRREPRPAQELLQGLQEGQQTQHPARAGRNWRAEVRHHQP